MSKPWKMLLPFVLALAGCAIEGPSDDDDPDAMQTRQGSGKGPAWGMVLGAIADGGTSEVPNHVNLDDHPEAVICDLQQLGVGWVRTEVGFGESNLEVTADFIAMAHDAGLKVLVVVLSDGFSCEASSCAAAEKAWRDDFAATLTNLIDVELTGNSAADAYEISNEPNISQKPEYVAPGPFARLLETVWNDVKLPRAARGQAPLFVSGGLANSFSNEGWWQGLFAALPGGEPPWDVFGVHPYNQTKYDNGCAPGDNGCDRAERWAQLTAASLGEVSSTIEGKYPAFFSNKKPRIWATEVGWDARFHYEAGRDQADMFDLTHQALAGLERAFWYVYRDDEPTPGTEYNKMGVRFNSLGGYGERPIYARMAQKTGAAGQADACYPKVGMVGCEPDPDGALGCGPHHGGDTGDDCLYASETGYAVDGALYRFYQENGGLQVFGHPIGPARCMANPDPVGKKNKPWLWSQWFERQRMEYHADFAPSQRVALGRLGAERAEMVFGNTLDPPGTGGYAPPSGSCKHFDATGIDMCGDLLAFYEGKLASSVATKLSPLELLGYPVTGAFDTMCPVGSSMRPCLVQYTERARLEVHHADYTPSDTHYVMRGLLGAELKP